MPGLEIHRPPTAKGRAVLDVMLNDLKRVRYPPTVDAYARAMLARLLETGKSDRSQLSRMAQRNHRLHKSVPARRYDETAFNEAWIGVYQAVNHQWITIERPSKKTANYDLVVADRNDFRPDSYGVCKRLIANAVLDNPLLDRNDPALYQAAVDACERAGMSLDPHDFSVAFRLVQGHAHDGVANVVEPPVALPAARFRDPRGRAGRTPPNRAALSRDDQRVIDLVAHLRCDTELAMGSNNPERAFAALGSRRASLLELLGTDPPDAISNASAMGLASLFDGRSTPRWSLDELATMVSTPFPLKSSDVALPSDPVRVLKMVKAYRAIRRPAGTRIIFEESDALGELMQRSLEDLFCLGRTDFDYRIEQLVAAVYQLPGRPVADDTRFYRAVEAVRQLVGRGTEPPRRQL